MISEELLKQAIAETHKHGQAYCVTTRDGRAVRVYADDHIGTYTIIGAHMADEGWAHSAWVIDGRNMRNGDDSPHDIIPARRSGEVTLYVYEIGGSSRLHSSTDGTLQHLGWRLVARVPVKWTEGDGL